MSFRDGQNMNVISYQQIIDFMNLVSEATYVNEGYFLALFWDACFYCLLGSLAGINILTLFMLVQGELHTVDFLLGHTVSVLTVSLWFIGT